MREGRYAKSPNENQEKYCRANTLYKVCRKKEGFFLFSDNFLLREMRLHNKIEIDKCGIYNHKRK